MDQNTYLPPLVRVEVDLRRDDYELLDTLADILSFSRADTLRLALGLLDDTTKELA
jgi:hypothetical protein